MMIISREFVDGSQLILTIDRRQWKNHHLFVMATIYKKRALYHFEKRMLRIVRGIKIIFSRHPFDKKDDFQPKKWY
ncbi:MAG: hypothetical protein F6K25_32025 [Okeania sp. SIO2G4]|uniref:hypothetical protein n=1 Tax=unclassified Okeania TaxID=2634635 RepID=UPI0013BD12E0|nr:MULTISPECIES: hypothetical protein [unclassified Okeania]NEP76094.1 hypothetical protein [Okeania sp. SIO2G5]NEP97273.1 hypothetical protein [Okeania sp. SIO2F5]NEQ94995.1 hypothetical protein [Okeania sp. SIO2G4]